MIYTLTLNPAIDYVVHVDELSVGSIQRSTAEHVFFGGKGINVSIILQEHGVPSVAMGFLSGFTGKAMEEHLTERGIATDFVYLQDGITRINVKIRAKEETDINGQGPAITQSDLLRLYEKLERLQDGDTLVLAGSIPASLPQDIYEEVMKRLTGKQISFAVDATGELLLKTLPYRPFLVKPNAEELGELFSVTVRSPDDAGRYAEKLQEMGAQNVLVSMGGDGAVLLDKTGKKHYRKAYAGKVVNTVGAGDSMVAGFLAGYAKTRDYAAALQIGSASGSATAFSEGLADIEAIKAILKSL